MRTLFIRLSLVFMVLSRALPVIASPNIENLNTAARDLAKKAHDYIILLDIEKYMGRSNQGDAKKKKLLKQISKYSTIYNNNLKRYFGFRIIYSIYGQKLQKSINNFRQEVQKTAPEMNTQRFDQSYRPAFNQHMEACFLNWEKLHSAFKHYKGHML